MRRMVRTIVACFMTLAGTGWADQVYTWKDAGGTVHYSNTPTVGRSASKVYETPAAAPEEAPAVAGTEAFPTDSPAAAVPSVSSEDAAALSASASLRRNALERELRATATQIRELDTRLTKLGRVRTQHSRGSAATGGVAAPALDVRSEEEVALDTERERLVKHANEVRAASVTLRQEVTSRLGSTPAWWNDIR